MLKTNKEFNYDLEYVNRFTSGNSPKRIQRLFEYIRLSKDQVIADFGCGNANLLECLQGKIKAYSGIDLSRDFIAAANRKKEKLGFKDAEFYCESIQSFCHKHQNKFDAGFALDLAEHINDGEWQNILKAIYGSLKPGGKFYLHTPNADFFLEMMKERNLIFKQFPEHIAVRNAEKNLNLLREAGFIKTQLFFLPHYNYLKHLHHFSFLPLIGKFFKARIFIISEK